MHTICSEAINTIGHPFINHPWRNICGLFNVYNTKFSASHLCSIIVVCTHKILLGIISNNDAKFNKFNIMSTRSLSWDKMWTIFPPPCVLLCCNVCCIELRWSQYDNIGNIDISAVYNQKCQLDFRHVWGKKRGPRTNSWFYHMGMEGFAGYFSGKQLPNF